MVQVEVKSKQEKEKKGGKPEIPISSFQRGATHGEHIKGEHFKKG